LLTYVRADVFNVYGPTEVCVTSSVALNSEMLGVPLNNTQYYVLDNELQFTPFNGVGELYIGGDGLARGYLNRPELTEKHFIVNPFYDPESAGSSTRLYKTGDLVRYLPDGNLSFVGRVDDQVKIRGFRIELGELENQIASIDVVDAAVVMTFEISGSMQLVGYVKPVENTSELGDVKFIGEIKEKLKQRVPSYMIPTIFLAVKEWPLTVNGKINRRILPAPDISAHQGNYVRPRTELEYKLRSIWSDTLALSPEAIGINSSFFDLGGHSLLAVKLLSAIQSQLCSSVELTMLFSSDTISEQAKCIECLQNERQSSLLYKITKFDSHSSAVIFVPGAASTAKDFTEIFSALNRDDAEIAVLKHKGLLLGDEYFATVEEAATTYGELLLSTKLTQFKLVGHSFGGVLAIEIARYLLSHNCTVEVLLLETYFLAVAFIRDEERDVQPKNQVTITDIPAHMLALYEHQSRLSDSYSPIGSIDCNVSLVFATESPIELSIYKQYLDEELKFQYKQLSLIKGNHMGILKGHGAVEIANLVSLFNEHKV
jgi:acyl carrier protein